MLKKKKIKIELPIVDTPPNEFFGMYDSSIKSITTSEKSNKTPRVMRSKQKGGKINKQVVKNRKNTKYEVNK